MLFSLIHCPAISPTISPTIPQYFSRSSGFYMHREHLTRHNQTKTHTSWEKWGNCVIKNI